MESRSSRISSLCPYTLLLLLTVTQVACGAQFSTTYQAFSAFHGGYQESDEGDGVYTVAYFGGRPGMAEKGAAYRCAELAYEKGYRTFILLDGKNYSGLIHGGSGTNGMVSSVHMGDVRLKIRLGKFKTGSEDVVDAYDVLDHMPVPGTEMVNSVSQREQGKAAGPRAESR